MALFTQQMCSRYCSPSITISFQRLLQSIATAKTSYSSTYDTNSSIVARNVSRRQAVLIASTTVLFPALAANALDFNLVAPDQTVEEAETGIRDHAASLLQVKSLLETESWKEAQKALRSSSGYLKQDIHTLIQSKPAPERPALRKLYSLLFNTVSKLAYAARDRDKVTVWQCYDGIVTAVDDILSRIS